MSMHAVQTNKMFYLESTCDARHCSYCHRDVVSHSLNGCPVSGFHTALAVLYFECELTCRSSCSPYNAVRYMQSCLLQWSHAAVFLSRFKTFTRYFNNLSVCGGLGGLVTCFFMFV